MIIVLSNFVLADYVKVISINVADSGTMFATDFTETLRIYKDGRWGQTPWGPGTASGVTPPCYWTAYPEGYSGWFQSTIPAKGFWSCGSGGNNRIGYAQNDYSANNHYDHMKLWNPYPSYNELNFNQANWKITCTEQYGMNLGEASGWIYSPAIDYPWFQIEYPNPIIISPCWGITVSLISATAEYVDFRIEDRGHKYPPYRPSGDGDYCQDYDPGCGGRSIGGLEIGYEQVCTLDNYTGCIDNQRWRYDSCNNPYENIENCTGSCQADSCCDCTLGTCCSDGCNYDAAGTICDDIDHCSGETWYTGHNCDDAGSCTDHRGPQDKDDDESYCTSTANDCIPRNWDVGGKVAKKECCGDDAGEFYDGAGTCDGTHACCDSALEYVMGGKCVPDCIKPRWENLFENEITDANKGDTVRLVLRNTGLSEGDTIQFEIYEGSDAIMTSADAIIGTVDNGVVVAHWTITQEDLDKTISLNNFYLTTNFSGEVSNYLSIFKRYDNTPTTTDVISPSCGSYFDAGPGIVDITVSAEDDDDLVEGTLSVNGVQIATFGNRNVTTGYTFSTGGNYKIVAETTNNRGQQSRTISNVMVIDTTIDGEYVAACITSPEDYSNIPTSTVKFDASDSLGIRYNAATGITTKINPSGLDFDWSFSDGRNNPHHLGTTELSYNFFKNFHAVGSNWATLQVSII